MSKAALNERFNMKCIGVFYEKPIRVFYDSKGFCKNGFLNNPFKGFFKKPIRVTSSGQGRKPFENPLKNPYFFQCMHADFLTWTYPATEAHLHRLIQAVVKR